MGKPVTSVPIRKQIKHSHTLARFRLGGLKQNEQVAQEKAGEVTIGGGRGLDLHTGGGRGCSPECSKSLARA
eukprot:101225-Prorocentrum_minimum.AAC.1